jgi:lipopolysaccharide biosynthesis glycosyltransferase
MQVLETDMPHIHVALCVDGNYLFQCATLIKSIALFTRDAAAVFHIFSENGNAAAKIEQCLAGSAHSAVFYAVSPDEVEKLPIHSRDHVNAMTYWRITLSRFLPPGLDKVLYLDCDMLTVDSVKSLWETDISSFAMAAVPDIFCDDIRRYNRLDYKPLSYYFNAGAILINLDFWRNYDIAGQTIRYLLESGEKCVYHDQDALNHVLAGKIKVLDARYNMQCDFFGELENLLIRKEYITSIVEGLNNPCIIHFAGSTKPWHKQSLHPYTGVWRKIQRLTSWEKQIVFNEYAGLRLFRYYIRVLLEKLKLYEDKNLYKRGFFKGGPAACPPLPSR